MDFDLWTTACLFRGDRLPHTALVRSLAPRLKRAPCNLWGCDVDSLDASALCDAAEIADTQRAPRKDKAWPPASRPVPTPCFPPARPEHPRDLYSFWCSVALTVSAHHPSSPAHQPRRFRQSHGSPPLVSQQQSKGGGGARVLTRRAFPQWEEVPDRDASSSALHLR